MKTHPPLRGKAGMGVKTRNEAPDPHPNLPPARGKEPERFVGDHLLARLSLCHVTQLTA